MKKIQLTEGQPTSIRAKDETQEVIILSDIIISKCEKSGLSYVEVNKALYLADKELYMRTINERPSQYDDSTLDFYRETR